MPDSAETWRDSETVDLDGMRVTLSEPLLVGRRKGYFWFPNLWTMPNGELLSTISPVPDIHLSGVPYLVLWSRDGGLTWTEPQVSCDGGQTLLHMHSGDSILLPYDLRPRPQGIGAPHNIIPTGQRVFDYVPTGVTITDMPSPVPLIVPGLDVVSFSFNGETLWLQDGTYLATAYGHFEGDQRDSVVAVESTDGINWTFRSVIAGADCPVPGNGGPSESAICRTSDGRIMCVFRVESRMPLGQTWSNDEGRTWAPAVPMPGVFSVQPGLAVMADGAIALSAGRPGLYLWLNTDGRRPDLAADRHPRPPQQLPARRTDHLLRRPLPPADHLLHRGRGRRREYAALHVRPRAQRLAPHSRRYGRHQQRVADSRNDKCLK